MTDGSSGGRHEHPGGRGGAPTENSDGDMHQHGKGQPWELEGRVADRNGTRTGAGMETG